MKTITILLLAITFAGSRKNSIETPKEKALHILETKCNVCHKKKNPFKIFNERNMEKHAPKIYQQVFVERRMPKGDEIKLSEQEYSTLLDWLKTQKING